MIVFDKLVNDDAHYVALLKSEIIPALISRVTVLMIEFLYIIITCIFPQTIKFNNYNNIYLVPIMILY